MLARESVPDGTVVWTENQYRGRGHGNSSWESEQGKNLTFSIILHPRFLEPAGQFYLSMTVSLAIVSFLKEFTENVFIKWPNDIYADNRKIAGILIENSVTGNKIADSVIGIGININQTGFGSHLPNPVSLKQITGKEFMLRECLDKICEQINYWYCLLMRGEKSIIADKYTTRLYRLNQESRYREFDIIFTAVLKGVDNFGRLALEMSSGDTRYFGLKEVEFID